jgi:hypothetical protein
MSDELFTKAQVVAIIKEALVDQYSNLLHPEFGSEWKEPDGQLYLAWKHGFEQGVISTQQSKK